MWNQQAKTHEPSKQQINEKEVIVNQMAHITQVQRQKINLIKQSNMALFFGSKVTYSYCMLNILSLVEPTNQTEMTTK